MSVKDLLNKPEFPRSANYDLDWMMDNQMGPSAVWLAEWLSSKLDLKPGMRVLDLGCGKAMSSIFLAREFGVRITAADLWMSPDHNWRRVREAGLEDLVCPVKAEAHALPFAEGYFDAAISIDAYQYFGTDEIYLDYLSRFVRPGGSLAVIVAGLARPLPNPLPEYLTTPQSNGKIFWEDSCRCFKTIDFWRELWAGNGQVEGVEADILPDGWRHWRDFENALRLSGKSIFPSDEEALSRDAGKYLAFIRIVARKTASPAGGMDVNLYDPTLGAKVGIDN